MGLGISLARPVKGGSSSLYTLPVIEGFQQISGNVPTGGLLQWTYNDGHFDAGGTLTLSALHPGSGYTSSGLFETVPHWNEIYTGNRYGGEGYTSGLDLTGYNILKLDLYVTQADDADSLTLTASPFEWAGGSFGAGTLEGQTGQLTISLNISGMADKSNVAFSIASGNETDGTFTAYLQKLYAA